MVELTILSPQRVIFEGGVKSVILPGESGVFEILSFHKNIIARLIKGSIVVDGKNLFNIKRGVVKLDRNVATVIVEEG
jgi:F-type H+-transporting ATPase subunit epsilon